MALAASKLDTDADRLGREMPFAQVVSTAQGDALLIMGRVYHVTGPNGNDADLFARALRCGSTDVMAGIDLSRAHGGLSGLGSLLQNPYSNVGVVTDETMAGSIGAAQQ